MNRSLTLLLQVVIVLIGLAALAFLLGEPHFEGRNAHATTFAIYFKDPFLAYVYLGSAPFFIALCRAYGLFGHVRQTGAFSQQIVDALRAIKVCALVLIGFILGAAAIILLCGDGEDRPAGIAMSFLAIVASTAIAIAASVFARNLQSSLNRSVHTPPKSTPL